MLQYLNKVTIYNKEFSYFSIVDFAKDCDINLDLMPFSIKILMENLIRNCVQKEDIIKFCNHDNVNGDIEFPFTPARVLMQDFTGVPAVVDLAAMRNEMIKRGKNPSLVNPVNPTHLVIDHSIQVDYYGNIDSKNKNIDIEFQRNKERYEFLKWGKSTFSNFQVIPPGCGICHQINLEYLAKVVWQKNNLLYPDTVVGTDSHTTMINGIGVLGWGVGGIEAESVMLNQPIFMTKPDVIGVKLTGKLGNFVGAMDLVLSVTNVLRKKGVVGKFVEFFGTGVSNLSLPDRATVANMAPEYGATCGIFPIDDRVIDYLSLSGRSDEEITIVKEYSILQNMWFDETKEAKYTDIVELDLSSIEISLSGPKRPQDKVNLSQVSESFNENFKTINDANDLNNLTDGSIVIASITSCTNTSNPYSLISAGLLAKKAVTMGLKISNFVKTSFSPGSIVVGDYMKNSGLQEYLDELGFNIAGYGCMTCIGNSGPLNQEFENKIKDENYSVVAVISGNRNFEGRVHPLVKANYLASPSLVLAYAIAGNIKINLSNEALGKNKNGEDVYLKDILPSRKEVDEAVSTYIKSDTFKKTYNTIFDGNENWKNIKTTHNDIYNWPPSYYIENPPYFEDKNIEISDILGAKILASFGNFITTDHISPAGNISITSPAAKYLMENGISKENFNSYGSRRGSHSVMMRGTFANIRIKNELLDNIEGGFSKDKNGEIKSIYEVAMENKNLGIKSIIFAGREYGSGSSRDWAAKGTKLLGICSIIAESFERIHRSNLAGMGVLPFELMHGKKTSDLNLKNCNSVDIIGITKNITPKQILKCVIHYTDNTKIELPILCRLDTMIEVEYFLSGSIFHYIADKLSK